MNALLLQMLAARAGGNPDLTELVSRMGGGGANSVADLREILAQQAGSNPFLNLVMKQAESRSAQAAPAVIDVEPSSTVQQSPENVQERAENSEPTSEELETLTAELHGLRERNDLLGQALGACCCCWGQDPQCRLCRGRGRPGFSVPDERLFREFVLPAIQMLRAQKAGISGSSPPAKLKAAETNA
jgi:hypothetical protein